MDTRHDLTDEADQPAMPGQTELEASIKRSAAQIANGETVPLELVLKRLRASANLIRRERGAATGQAPAPKA